MVDPVQGVGKGVSEIAQQSQTDSASGASQAQGPSDSSFQEKLEGADEVDQTQGADGPQQVDETQKAEQVEMQDVEGVEDVNSASGKGDPTAEKLESFMKDLSEDKGKMDDMLDKAMSGENMNQEDLLETQAMVYQYSQKVELTSKVVEKGTSGLKKMLNMKV